MNSILTIQDLNVSIENKKIINNLSLDIKEKEAHVIMGPNGSGKSSLALSLMGHPKYKIESGSVSFCGKNLLKLSTDERSKAGLFLSFQQPREIEGLNVSSYLRTLDKNNKEKNNEKALSIYKFKKAISSEIEDMGLMDDFLKRDLNHGFSGGEKKKNEILQLKILSPKLAILDEIDSGLDVDALIRICKIVSELKDKGMSVIIITHYIRILEYLDIDFVHLMKEGNIIHSNDKQFAKTIDSFGYNDIKKLINN